MHINYFWKPSLFQRTERQKRLFDITQSIYLYHKIIMLFDITKSIFDNTKLIFWYHKFDFVIYKNHNIMILWYQKNLLCDIIKSNMWCHKFDFLILQNQFLIITKLILRYHKITNYLLMSQNRICDIENLNLWFLTHVTRISLSMAVWDFSVSACLSQS